MLEKEKLISLYLQFRDEALNIPHVDGTDIIKALDVTCFLKNRKATDGFVEFKDQIFGVPNRGEAETSVATEQIRSGVIVSESSAIHHKKMLEDFLRGMRKDADLEEEYT